MFFFKRFGRKILVYSFFLSGIIQISTLALAGILSRILVSVYVGGLITRNEKVCGLKRMLSLLLSHVFLWNFPNHSDFFWKDSRIEDPATHCTGLSENAYANFSYDKIYHHAFLLSAFSKTASDILAENHMEELHSTAEWSLKRS